MNPYIVIVVGLLLGCMSCTKETQDAVNHPQSEDYRNSVIGEYIGIQIRTYWRDTTTGFDHDTSNVMLTLAKSTLDSIITIHFSPEYSTEGFSFKVEQGRCIPTTDYHPPILRISNDSLYFHHQAGIGPHWIDCFAKKKQ